MSVHVTPAHPEDEAAVIALILAAMDTYQQWCPSFRTPADVEDRERARWRLEGSQARWLVARQRERIVGAARWVSDAPAVLSLLMIHPQSWQRGAGSALHQRVLSEISIHGLPSVRLTVPEANLRARRFYERHGWHRTPTAPAPHPWLGFCMLEYALALMR
jgi:GNAT superfamily N-acetyltransferase